MKTTTVTGSRFFLLTLVIGSVTVTPTAFGGTSLPGVPPFAVALGLKAPPPKLVISDPTIGLPRYTPPAPPTPLSTNKLTFTDFTPFVSSGTTQGWQQGSTPETIMIPPQPDSNTGLGDKAVALATSYDTASYEADVTVGSSAELNRSKPTIARGSMSLQCDPKIWQYVVIDYNAGSAYIPAHEANRKPHPRYRHRSSTSRSVSRFWQPGHDRRTPETGPGSNNRRRSRHCVSLSG